jgi:aerobic carbon-monoxide dehydrogenase large subunit
MTAPPDGFDVVGRSVVRPRARRLVEGRGRYTDDLVLPGMLHAAFVRSPHAHARIVRIDCSAARSAPGVRLVADGAQIAARCLPFAGMHKLFPGMKAPKQTPLAVDHVRWCGEPVAIVVAETRAQAEDAAELVEIEWDPRPAAADLEASAAGDAPAVHDAIPDNLSLETTVSAGLDPSSVAGAVVIEETFRFGRVTGVCLEPRTILADYGAADQRLVVHQSHQCPSQQQVLYARLLGLPEHSVRVNCQDVGGAFGVKQQLYGDEIAVCVASMLLERPVKFVADRTESFATDIHAREHVVRARLSADADGRILAFEIEDAFGIGAYSQYPRSSVGEGSHVLRLSAAAYVVPSYRSTLRMVLQNKNMVGHYRSVGHPIAVAVTEAMVDRMADRLGLDPVEARLRNYVPDDAYPYPSHGGFTLEPLSLRACMEKLCGIVDVAAFRREQADLRAKGIFRGIGFATVVEIGGTGPGYYGMGDVPVSAQDACHVRLEPSGVVRCFTSVTDQGQGTDTGIGQIVAEALGIPFAAVAVFSGDSETCPYGGGAWASRGILVGGEAAWRAARTLRDSVLAIAAAVLQTRPEDLDLKGGMVRDRLGADRMTIAEVARIGHFRQDLLPPGFQPVLAAVGHYVPGSRPFLINNCVHASIVEVDAETGFVRCLGHAVVDDPGRLINPSIVDEQIRGGVVQGLGAALFEEIRYAADGQLETGTMADYLVPMAVEMPDIQVDHVLSPTAETTLGAKGVGETGTAGAAAACLNAVNDAIRPFGATVAALPMTPERILRALGRIG